MYLTIYYRHPGASNQGCIHEFLFQIAQHYDEQANFVVDLLGVKVQGLFAVRESGEECQKDKKAVSDFKQDLWKFITQNEMKHKLLERMKDIMVRNACINVISL